MWNNINAATEHKQPRVCLYQFNCNINISDATMTKNPLATMRHGHPPKVRFLSHNSAKNVTTVLALASLCSREHPPSAAVLDMKKSSHPSNYWREQSQNWLISVSGTRCDCSFVTLHHHHHNSTLHRLREYWDKVRLQCTTTTITAHWIDWENSVYAVCTAPAQMSLPPHIKWDAPLSSTKMIAHKQTNTWVASMTMKSIGISRGW